MKAVRNGNSVDQRGFMTQGAHLIAVALLGVSLAIVARIVGDWVGWGLAFWVTMIILFFPLFILTHAVGDFIWTILFE